MIFCEKKFQKMCTVSMAAILRIFVSCDCTIPQKLKKENAFPTGETVFYWTEFSVLQHAKNNYHIICQNMLIIIWYTN